MDVSAGSITLRNNGLISSATYSHGKAGDVSVSAGSISLQNGGLIVSSTSGPGQGGNVEVAAGGSLFISDAISVGPSGVTGISVQTRATQEDCHCTPGQAGNVTVQAGNLTIIRRGQIDAATFGSGQAGNVTVDVPGAILIDGAGGSSFATISSDAGSDAFPNSTGNAGQVEVRAGRLTIRNTGLISSDTYGTGPGGRVRVRVAGDLLVDGEQDNSSPTAISTRALRSTSGNAGIVDVSAGSITLRNNGLISSSTSSHLGQGGNVVVRGGDIRLDGPGSQIATISNATGNAGSITILAPRLSLRDGASISTEARSANGGNITMSLGDRLYLQRSSITTSVNGALGNGGNIIIDPQFVVLDRSVIQANAVGGRGGNVTISTSQLVQSANSAITASSGQPNLSGTVTISTSPLNLTGNLVVLTSELQATVDVLRQSCAPQGVGPRASLVVAGRGGLRQDPETTLPALYFANRPVRAGQDPSLEVPTPPLHTSITLSTRCG